MTNTHLTSHVPRVRTKDPLDPSRKKILRALLASATSFSVKESDYLNVATQLWAGLDTPRALACHMLLKYQEYAQLVNLRCDPSNYLATPLIVNGGFDAKSGKDFMDDYQATSVLSKWPNFVHKDLDPVSACKNADIAAEDSCRVSNHRLSSALYSPCGENSAYWHLIFEMQADLERVLGGFDPERWQEQCRFGPGRAQGQEGTVDYEKLVNRPSSTAEFLPVGASLVSESTPWLEALSGNAPNPFCEFSNLQEYEMEYRYDVTLEPGDRNIMVPKNAKTHRGIRPQPSLNVYAQLGLGNMIRDRLKTAGLDLDDQTPNQGLAKYGSESDRLSTIDLKGASGHICKMLVRILFRDRLPRWLYAMELCRTNSMLPHGCEDKDANWVPLQSFSAMGNGFTFELETLIFWAATRAVRRSLKDTLPYRVYGDDIICSCEAAERLIPFLSYLGFPTNNQKTFVSGPFRESCGADYWLGTNVRPIFFDTSSEELKEASKNGTSVLRWLQTCNSIRRLARRRNHGFGCDRRLLACWRTAVLCIPRNLRDSLKSPWEDVRDDTLITHFEDAATNPLITQCSSLLCATGPRLNVQISSKDPHSSLGVRATLLYRARGVDRVTVRYDRSRSWLRRFLQNQTAERSKVQKQVEQVFGGGSTAPTTILPSLYSVRLGSGWEVFQPVSDDVEWR